MLKCISLDERVIGMFYLCKQYRWMKWNENAQYNGVEIGAWLWSSSAEVSSNQVNELMEWKSASFHT